MLTALSNFIHCCLCLLKMHRNCMAGLKEKMPLPVDSGCSTEGVGARCHSRQRLPSYDVTQMEAECPLSSQPRDFVVSKWHRNMTSTYTVRLSVSVGLKSDFTFRRTS